MFKARNSKSLSERVDTTFPARSQPARGTRWRLCLIAGGLPVVALAALHGMGSRIMYQSGPVSTAHHVVAQDCAACHTEAWVPVRRLFSIAANATSTPNAQCIACHKVPVRHDPAEAHVALHHENEVGSVHNCAECHREHVGKERLARVVDAKCTACHGELLVAPGSKRSFEPSIGSFAEHPEFAVFRPRQPWESGEAPSAAVRGDSPAGKEVETFSGADLDAYDRAHPRAPWLDKTRLRFNHALHLGAVDKDGKPRDLKSNVRKHLRDKLPEGPVDCTWCHVPEPGPDRRYMQPIHYERHCALCHENQLVPEFLEADLDGSPLAADGQPPTRRPVPHGSEQLVASDLRSRVAAWVMRPSGQAGPAADGPRPFPGLGWPEPVVSLLALTRIELNVAHAEQRLFAPPAAAAPAARIGCVHCHEVSAAAPAAAGLTYRVTRPDIPRQWQAHARFSHDSHREINCEQCHADVRLSTKTQHILLPRVNLCQNCHGHDTVGVTRARSDCAECHAFHRLDSFGAADFRGNLNLNLETVSPKREEGSPPQP